MRFNRFNIQLELLYAGFSANTFELAKCFSAEQHILAKTIMDVLSFIILPFAINRFAIYLQCEICCRSKAKCKKWHFAATKRWTVFYIVIVNNRIFVSKMLFVYTNFFSLKKQKNFEKCDRNAQQNTMFLCSRE